MSERDTGPETLNAYVDGELSRAKAASVARAAAGNPALAAQIATLREMKAAVTEVVPERGLALPARRFRPMARAAAAAAASLAVMVVVLTAYLHLWTEPVETRLAAFLQSHHAAWSFGPESEASAILPARAVSHLLPLDLESARLTFAGHEKIDFAGYKVLRTGYEGTRGCRVSLFVFPAGLGLDTSALAPSLLVHSWVIRDDTFALMADGMAQRRFDGIARAIEKTLRSGLKMDRGTRQKLARARRTSPPCSA